MKLVFKPQYFISGFIFLMVCAFGCFFDEVAYAAKPVMLQNPRLMHTHIPRISYVKNDTFDKVFELYSSSRSKIATILPQTTLMLPDQAALSLNPEDMLIIKCTKGSFLTMFLQFAGAASGTVDPEYDGPYIFAMWLGYPVAAHSSKIHVPYAVKKASIGTVGIQIGQQGDYRIVPDQNVILVV